LMQVGRDNNEISKSGEHEFAGSIANADCVNVH
jgi:hypothetical protein